VIFLMLIIRHRGILNFMLLENVLSLFISVSVDPVDFEDIYSMLHEVLDYFSYSVIEIELL